MSHFLNLRIYLFDADNEALHTLNNREVLALRWLSVVGLIAVSAIIFVAGLTLWKTASYHVGGIKIAAADELDGLTNCLIVSETTRSCELHDGRICLQDLDSGKVVACEKAK